jgi:serine phosphatase RsbU (regulator of sigma subunit)/pSer/pThr/pTyr-binding forkhead associated (FHA) protein
LNAAPSKVRTDAPRIEWCEEPNPPSVFILGDGVAQIGRRSDAQIVISHRLTSRQHASIERAGDTWAVVDVGSTHGTWINGARVDRHALRHGDRIHLGGPDGVELRFLTGDQPAAQDSILSTTGLGLSIDRLASVLPEDGAHSELEKISCLLELHYSVGKEFSAEKTFQHILKSALGISGAERGFVLRRGRDQFEYAVGMDGKGRLLSEGEFHASQTVVTRVTTTGEPVFMTQGIAGDLAGQASIVAMNLRAVACLPLEAVTQSGGAAIRGILYLDSRKPMHSLSGLDEKLLRRLAGEAGHVLEKLELVETLAERQRVEQELAVAEETQRTLLPRTLPEFDPYRIRAFSKATRHLGGDFYDFIPAGEDQIALVLADVSGKGIPAALLSSLALGAINTEYSVSAHPAIVLNGANKLLCRKTPSNRFVTLFLCQLGRDGSGEYISAGHNTTFIYRASGGGLEELGAGGMPLGMFPFAQYDPAGMRLEPGDLLVVYSDGLTDAENPAGQEWGEERLRELILTTGPNGAEALEAALLGALDQFTKGAPQTDDITLMIVERQA